MIQRAGFVFCRLPVRLAVAGAMAWPLLASAYCEDPAGLADSRVARQGNGFDPNELFDGPTQGDAKAQLGSLARQTLVASLEVRSAEHAGRASYYDLDQAQASKRPLLSVSGNVGAGQSRVLGQTQSIGGLGGVSVSATAPLYDGGRLDRLSEWREQLARAADTNLGATREHMVNEALVTVLDLNRYRLQTRVYQQYAGKMSCLVRSLEQVVASDRGRASELLQARKSQRQAEISRDEALSLLRQADVHLRKLVANNVEPWGAVGVPLAQVPDLATVIEQIKQSPDVRRLKLQADASDTYAEAAKADAKPKVSWNVGSGANRVSQTTTTNWSAGVSVTYVLDDGGVVKSASGAAQERAYAARRDYEALLSERTRMARSYHESASNAFARARQLAEVLKDSDQVRNATYEQWARLGRRSLFDLMSAESEHYNLRISYLNALHDGFAASAQLRSLGQGLLPWMAPELAGAKSR
jgi:outer membrane protein, adhesin transport system